MSDRTKPYIDESYSEMMQRLRESLPPEESREQQIQRWRQSADPSLRLLNFFGENINIGDSVNFLRYTTAKGLELSGPLNASSATITGTIIAAAGNIGGWTLDKTAIYTGTEDHTGYTTNAGDITLYSSGGNASIHARNFYIDASGNITARTVNLSGQIRATSGNIGGFYIGNNDIWGGNPTIGNAATTVVLGNLGGTSKIALGPTADSITIAGTQSGFIADGGGNLRVGDANSFLKWSGGALAIQMASGEAITISAGGDIQLVGNDANPAKIIWTASPHNIELFSDVSGTMFWNPTSPGGGLFIGGVNSFTEIVIAAGGSDGVGLSAFTDSNNSADFNVTASGHTFNLEITNVDYGMVLLSGTLRPQVTNRLDLGSATYNWKDIYLTPSGGTDNTVCVFDGEKIVTDEIDSRVWGSSLVDAANGVNNRLATFTDSNSLNGEANLTFDGSTLTLTGDMITLSGGRFGIGVSALDTIISWSKLDVQGSDITAISAFDFTDSATAGGALTMGFARNTQASPATVVNGDRLGFFMAQGHDGSDWQRPATITFTVDGAVSGGVVPTRISFDTGSALGNRTERFAISSTGIITISGLTASSDVQTNASKELISTSDKRLKKHLGNLEDGALDKLMRITPVYFAFKSDLKLLSELEARTLGFYAQDINLIQPEAAPYNEKEDNWGFNGRAMLAWIVKAVQELNQTQGIETKQLKSELQSLTKQLGRLSR